MTHFYAEVTDTFSGEANYCWVRRYKIKASTFTGAIRKVPGFKWRIDYGDDMIRYNAIGAAVCCFVEEWEDDRHSSFEVEEL